MHPGYLIRFSGYFSSWQYFKDLSWFKTYKCFDFGSLMTKYQWISEMSKNVYFLSIDAKRDFFDFFKLSHFFKKSHKNNNLPLGNLHLLAYCSKGSLVTISNKISHLVQVIVPPDCNAIIEIRTVMQCCVVFFFKSSSETKTVVHFDKEDFWDTLYVFYRKMTNDAILCEKWSKIMGELDHVTSNTSTIRDWTFNRLKFLVQAYIKSPKWSVILEF